MRQFRALLESRAEAGRFVCIGLDPDVDPDADMFPPDLKRGTDEVTKITQLCRRIIAGTAGGPTAAVHPAAFKLNLGFFLRHGQRGIEALLLLISMIRKLAPEAIVILDGKFGDITNSAKQYAHAAFVRFGADAVTVSPYMGEDAIAPFAEYKDKGVFVLCRTSNPSAARYQDVLVDGVPIYVRVARDMVTLNERFGNIGLVVGATVVEPVILAREAAPNLPFLLPGFGKKQGAMIGDIIPFARDGRGQGILANLSSDFAKAWVNDPHRSVESGARTKLEEIHEQIRLALL